MLGHLFLTQAEWSYISTADKIYLALLYFLAISATLQVVYFTLFWKR